MWSIKMVFTASKHGPEDTRHCTPARTPKQAWRGLGRTDTARPRHPWAHAHAHADAQDTGALDRVSEQLSNSGISKQVGQKIFFLFFFSFFFFLLFLFSFFFLFWVGQHILVETKGNALFFFSKNFFFLSLWSSLVPRLVRGPTGRPKNKKQKQKKTELDSVLQGGFSRFG